MPHFRSGAADYQTYLQRAEQMCEEVVDISLPQYGEEEIQYEGDGQKGYWVALNRRDNDGGRFENTTEVHTATSWKFALWKCTEAYLKRWTLGWYRWNPQDYEILSRSLCYVLRHVGCTHGQFFGLRQWRLVSL
jgi:hypothetical protein